MLWRQVLTTIQSDDLSVCPPDLRDEIRQACDELMAVNAPPASDSRPVRCSTSPVGSPPRPTSVRSRSSGSGTSSGTTAGSTADRFDSPLYP